MLEKNAGKIRGKNRIIMGKIHGGNGWRMICSVDFPHVFSRIWLYYPDLLLENGWRG
jgi:hypothetical protein